MTYFFPVPAQLRSLSRAPLRLQRLDVLGEIDKLLSVNCPWKLGIKGWYAATILAWGWRMDSRM